MLIRHTYGDDTTKKVEPQAAPYEIQHITNKEQTKQQKHKHIRAHNTLKTKYDTEHDTTENLCTKMPSKVTKNKMIYVTTTYRYLKLT